MGKEGIWAWPGQRAEGLSHSPKPPLNKINNFLSLCS